MASPLPLSRLAEQLMIDRTSLYRAIEAKGWVTIAAGAGKTKLALLTATGRTAMEDAEADWEPVQTRIVGPMGEQRWAELATLTGLVQQGDTLK